jgi:hypothetical protein
MRGKRGVAGSQPMRTAVNITWHGAQINFGDLTPYLTYGWGDHMGREGWDGRDPNPMCTLDPYHLPMWVCWWVAWKRWAIGPVAQIPTSSPPWVSCIQPFHNLRFSYIHISKFCEWISLRETGHEIKQGVLLASTVYMQRNIRKNWKSRKRVGCHRYASFIKLCICTPIWDPRALMIDVSIIMRWCGWIGSGSRILGQRGSGSWSRVLMAKNLRKNTAEKKIFLIEKIAIYLSPGVHTRRPTTGKAFSQREHPALENIKFLHFFIFLWVICIDFLTRGIHEIQTDSQHVLKTYHFQRNTTGLVKSKICSFVNFWKDKMY